jgi:DNA gyrase subunit A
MGRTARGVRGMRLAEGDYVVGAVLVDESRKLVTVTEKGYGKRSDFTEFRQMKNRGGMGVACHKISDKTGLLAGIGVVDEQDDLMLITDQGTIIRTPVSGINTYSRTASGVIVMRLGDDQKLVNFTTTPHAEERMKKLPRK